MFSLGPRIRLFCFSFLLDIAETLGVDAGDSVFDIASFTGREQVSWPAPLVLSS